MTALNKEKLLKQLTKRQRRRREQQPSVAVPEAKPASAGLQHRMIAYHEDLLQNIEFFVLEAYRRDTLGGIDDRAVLDGYRKAILGDRSDNSPSGMVVFTIANARAMRESIGSVDDALWRDALRVLMRSVKKHSELRPGETSYLDFVGYFVR